MKKRTIQKVLLVTALCGLQSVYSMDYDYVNPFAWLRWWRTRSPQVTKAVEVKVGEQPGQVIIEGKADDSIVDNINTRPDYFILDKKLKTLLKSADDITYISALATIRRSLIQIGQAKKETLLFMANIILDRALDSLDVFDFTQGALHLKIENNILQKYIINGSEYYGILDWDTLLYGDADKINRLLVHLRIQAKAIAYKEDKAIFYEIADYFNQIINQLNSISWPVAYFMKKENAVYADRLESFRRTELMQFPFEYQKYGILQNRQLKLSCQIPGRRLAQIKAGVAGVATVTAGSALCALGYYLSQSGASEKAIDSGVKAIGSAAEKMVDIGIEPIK